MLRINLYEIQNEYKIDTKINSFKIPSNFPDILSIKNIQIKGILKPIKQGSIIKADLNIKSDCVMACAISLKEVDVSLNFNLELLFGPTKECDYSLEDPLKLDEVILGNIISELPNKVIHKDSELKTFEKPEKIETNFQRELKKLKLKLQKKEAK